MPPPKAHNSFKYFVPFDWLNPIQTGGDSTLDKKININYFKTVQAMTTKLSNFS